MKNKLIPILLIAGAAVALYAFSKRKGYKKLPVEAGETEIQTKEQFEADYSAAQPKSLVDTASSLVKKVFSKEAKAARQSKKVAVKRAVSKGISKKKAKAVTKSLATGIKFAGFDDSSVLC